MVSEHYFIKFVSVCCGFVLNFDLDFLYLIPGSYKNKRIKNWLCFVEVLIDFGLRKLFP